ncbi:Hypothetical predicted protein [Olea europaea subsp. europaea]|uniref:Uncharacterized protein n=1 Tax=Olea europaea subsp. europaea TaxID=158383 RepID=A0A8S0Q1V2_OLEEU|nr:Hypothetical predicted protein [Olea europaea subsp. europaea]
MVVVLSDESSLLQSKADGGGSMVCVVASQIATTMAWLRLSGWVRWVVVVGGGDNGDVGGCWNRMLAIMLVTVDDGDGGGVGDDHRASGGGSMGGGAWCHNGAGWDKL